MNKLIVLGAGGHAKVVADIARLSGWDIVGFLDNINQGRKGETFCGSTILGGHEVLDELLANDVKHAIVAFGDNRIRIRSAEKLSEMGFKIPSVFHPSAIYAEDVEIGGGTVVAAGAIIGPSTAIGKCTIINTQASVDHDCRVCDGVHIGPGAILAGAVEVEKCAWIGAGAVISDHKKIGSHSIIGAGAVVVKDIPDDVVAMGVPAKITRNIIT